MWIDITITVNPINDPPVISQGLDQTVHHTQDFASVNLDDYVTDVDNFDNEIQWSYSGDIELIVDITNRILTVNKPNTEWLGSEDITFTASDGELFDEVTATFTVVFHNDPPVIVSDIQGETINENGLFETIYLDDKVDDPDHADDKLIWSIKGMVNLAVNGLSQRILTIAPADSEWAGSETIRFIVTDPAGLKDSTEATYTIIAVNDPPELGPLPLIIFNEDTSYTITKGELQLLVSDPALEAGMINSCKV